MSVRLQSPKTEATGLESAEPGPARGWPEGSIPASSDQARRASTASAPARGHARQERFDAPRGAPLRVGWLISPLSHAGGTFTHLRHWAEGLSPDRVRLTLFYHSPEEAEGARPELPSHVTCVRLPALDLRRRSPIAALGETARAVRAHRIELLHSIFIAADLVGLLVSRLLRIPIVSSVEGALLVEHLPPATRQLLAMFYRGLSSRFAEISAVSQATADGLKPLLHPFAPSPRVCYPGLPPLPRRPLPAGPPHLVAVGRVAPVKGLPLLVEAMGRLVLRLPELHLTVVGDGPDRDPLWALVRSRGLEQHIHITGWCRPEEVGAWLERAHLLVMPSYHEGLPWAALEAMARGVPVVASRVGGLPELVVEGGEASRTGYLVEPNRSDLLTITLSEVLERPDRDAHLERMGEHAQARVRSSFSAEAELRALSALYGDASRRTL